METLPAPDVFGNTIFCDDIRANVGGKLTFVGCYFTDMFVHGSFPFSVQKFCMAVTYWQRHTHLILPVVFWVFLPGDSDEKASMQFGTTEALNEEVLEGYKKRAIESGIENPQYSMFAAQFAVTDMVIREPGYIRVRAVRGNQLVRLGSLRVQAAPTPQEPPVLT